VTNFVAITDPGSQLVKTAEELKFRRVFLNQSDIGGRYSALSYFGMAPAALMGLDLRKLLEGARQAAHSNDAAVELGVTMGDNAAAGRDKLTLVIDRSLETLGLWIEQLIAESTGKEGTGILPVNGEPLGAPDVYGNDRLFVSIHSAVSQRTHGSQLLQRLVNRSSIVSLMILYDLGAEFFTWEFATAVAGWVSESIRSINRTCRMLKTRRRTADCFSLVVVISIPRNTVASDQSISVLRR
jgi:glucose-6-phosphate isomerase/transaldolase/glucose-6-phosphate isomerase